MSPLSLGAEAEANESGSDRGGQITTSSEWNDDNSAWDWDDARSSCEELREYFSVCRIDPRLGCDCRESASQVGSLFVFRFCFLKGFELRSV
jgi:hypothetical protein